MKFTIDVYDPAMCCSTGVCGPDVDDSLADFANDVKWMKTQGIKVNRYNLGQEPEVFKENAAVLSRLKKEGSAILPIIFINGEMYSEGGYPGRQQLMDWISSRTSQTSNGAVKISANKDKILSELEEAVAVGDEAGLQTLFQKGKTNGVSVQLLAQAMQAGINHRQRVTQATLQAANRLLGVQAGGCTPGGGCC